MVTQRDVEYKSDLLWVLLIDRRLDWKWVGVAHETLVCPEAAECGYLSGIVNLYLNDGHRSRDPKKKAEVIRILKEALESEPQNARYAFYLAQAYRGAERYREAIEVYERRTKMGGSGEEIYSSLYWMARLQEELGMDPEIFIGSFAKAHQHSPSRVEPLYSLVAHYIKIKQFLLGYHVVNYAFTLAPLHCSATYVQKWMYEWGILYELFVCAFSIGKKSEARQAAEKLFSLQSFPDDLRKNIQRHL
jgi:tetratricopeptide (TPR) repeat protein